MVNNWVKKVNGRYGLQKSDVLVVGIILLVGAGSFGLGRLSVDQENQAPIQIRLPDTTPAEPSRGDTISAEPKQGALVGSRSGTTYYYPWCSGAKRIKEQNKVWFATKAEAQAKGYTPAGNCLGL